MVCGDGAIINNIETGVIMAAGRKKTAAKRGATTARRGRTASMTAKVKAKAPTPPRRKAPARKAAQKAPRSGAQVKRAPSSRGAARLDAVLAAQLEAIAQDLELIREFRTELSDLRIAVETLTGMVEDLAANQRAQDGNPEPEIASEENGASPVQVDEPETAESTSSDL